MNTSASMGEVRVNPAMSAKLISRASTMRSKPSEASSLAQPTECPDICVDA